MTWLTDPQVDAFTCKTLKPDSEHEHNRAAAGMVLWTPLQLLLRVQLDKPVQVITRMQPRAEGTQNDQPEGLQLVPVIARQQVAPRAVAVVCLFCFDLRPR